MGVMCLCIISTRTVITITLPLKMSIRQSSDINKFKETLKNAKKVVILSGAGLSAESGVPTFRGDGALWRRYSVLTMASPGAFQINPALVWDFYHYRRQVAANAQPNSGHHVIADFEAKHGGSKEITVITQNVDGLHTRAGSKNVLELHGNLFKTRCTECQEVLENYDDPICEALANRGMPDPDYSDVPVDLLPHCKKSSCGALLRPHIVWFGESLDFDVLKKAKEATTQCEVCLVVGTSSVVYPAAMFAPEAARRGATVAEFNLEHTPATQHFHYYFEGPCGNTLPEVLG